MTDASLAGMNALTRLRWLTLNGSHITDDGLGNLSGLPRLEVLSLENTPITDAGLIHLSRLSSLQTLFLRGTNVTKGGGCTLQDHPSPIRGISLGTEEQEVLLQSVWVTSCHLFSWKSI